VIEPTIKATQRDPGRGAVTAAEILVVTSFHERFTLSLLPCKAVGDSKGHDGIRTESATESTTYNSPIESVYSATVKVASQQGYTIRSAFPEAHVVSFTTGRLKKRGHDLTATAIGVSPEITRVVIAGVSGDGVSSLELGHSFTAWDEKKKLALHCLLQIERALAPERSPTGDEWGGGLRLPVERYKEMSDHLLRALRRIRTHLSLGDTDNERRPLEG
jgi:hypothetical protein